MTIDFRQSSRMVFSVEAFFQESREPLFSLVLSSAEGEIVAANPAFARLVGVEPEAIVGTPFTSYLARTSLPSFQSAFVAARTGQRVRFHVLVRNADGTEQALEANGTPSTGYFHCVGRRVLWVGNDVGEHVSREVLFQNVVRGVVDALGPRYVMLTRAVGWPVQRAEVIAGWADGHPADPYSYDVVGMPCQGIMRGDAVSFRCDVRKVFPNIPMLDMLNAESYYGVPIRDEMGMILGSVCIVDDRPKAEANEAQILGVLRSAGRAASREMAKMRAEMFLSSGLDSATLSASPGQGRHSGMAAPRRGPGCTGGIPSKVACQMGLRSSLQTSTQGRPFGGPGICTPGATATSTLTGGTASSW